MLKTIVLVLLTASLAWTGCNTPEPDVRVAAASNFSSAITELAEAFEARTGYTVGLSFGSTGKHVAQITHGAPFDVFFAADAIRPERLEKSGLGVPGTRATYAIGILVLWSPSRQDETTPDSTLRSDALRHLAIANPKHAPYGKAAEEFLRARGLWDVVADRLVYGENVGQAFQYVKSGNAEWGLVSCAQVRCFSASADGSFWIVPDSLHAPIVQQAVLLNDTKPARQFLEFVQSAIGRGIIRDAGYHLP